MTPQPPNSPTPPWKCSGVYGKKHPPYLNQQFKCKYCDRTYDNYLKEHPIQEEGRIKRILLSSSGIAAIAALVLVIGAIVYARQKFAEADRAIIQLENTNAELTQVNTNLEQAKQKLKSAEEELKRVPQLEKSLQETKTELESTKTNLQTTQFNLEETNQNLTQTKERLQQKTRQVTEGRKCVKLMSEINHVTWKGAALDPQAVMRIQQNLQSLGFYQGEIDGTFAEITRKAANNFQKNCQFSLK